MEQRIEAVTADLLKMAIEFEAGKRRNEELERQIRQWNCFAAEDGEAGSEFVDDPVAVFANIRRSRASLYAYFRNSQNRLAQLLGHVAALTAALDEWSQLAEHLKLSTDNHRKRTRDLLSSDLRTIMEQVELQAEVAKKAAEIYAAYQYLAFRVGNPAIKYYDWEGLGKMLSALQITVTKSHQGQDVSGGQCAGVETNV
jgi:hypothetical protein